MTQQKKVSGLDKFFGVTAAGSSMKVEIMAGLTTFFAMAYIIFVNPTILNQFYVINDQTEMATAIASSVFVATCLSAFVGTLLMAVYAKLPFAQASGMGLNAFFAYTVMLGSGYSFNQALAIVFISGLLFIVITAFGLREAIYHAIPKNVRIAISAGIGLFIPLIGLLNAKVIQGSDSTTVALHSFNVWNADTAGALLCLIGLVMTIALVKDKPGEEAAVDEEGTRKSLLTSIMKTDVYSLSREATVEEAMRLFVEKNISAAPIVDEAGEPVGFISDGDILKRLSPRSNSFTDPIVLINSTVNDDEGYDEKLAKVMQMRASEIGAASPICVSVHANLTDVCRVLSENHLKKVPVLEAGHIVGIINRSDITQYSMAAYLADHPERAVYCGEGPSGQHECVEEACEEC